jgi:hypothetical protein
MRKKLTATHGAAWLLAGAALAVSGQAHAQAIAACPLNSTTVYVSGSSAFVPALQPLADNTNLTIVSLKPGSCEGLQAMGLVNAATAITATSAALITPHGTAGSCNPAGAFVDIGASDVYVNTCKTYDPTLPATVPAGFVDNLGPIQAMTIAVPTSSTATNISAEAAYMVFGFDAATTATTINPWNVPTDIFVRFYDSGTLEMIGKAIGLDGGFWKNATVVGTVQAPAPPQQQGSGSALAGAMATKAMTAADVDPTIGVLSSSSLTTSVRPLAFQATGQTCSYLPDSTSSHTTTDKINVRQGRYDIWGPEHLVTPVDGSGNIKGSNGNTAAVQAAITMAVSSSKALPSQSDAGVPEAGVSPLTEAAIGNFIKAFSVASVGFIPWCAMEVQRTTEVGPESSYAPPAGCSCLFEAANSPVLGHDCTMLTCSSNADCATKTGTPACHFGYCEAE